MISSAKNHGSERSVSQRQRIEPMQIILTIVRAVIRLRIGGFVIP